MKRIIRRLLGLEPTTLDKIKELRKIIEIEDDTLSQTGLNEKVRLKLGVLVEQL